MAHNVGMVNGLPAGTDGYPWWNDTVFYEIFIRSFYDSDGDGIGDINGLIEKLDYLNDGNLETSSDLGINGIWLMPIHPATSYHGYDVIDYFAINPEYGTMEDFERLLEEAHRRGIRVIIDLVLNHTSSEHPWFVASYDPASEMRSWYVWFGTEPTGSGWYKADTGYYLGIFSPGMPDLNYTNPAVNDQMYAVSRFWLQDIGVDGFRLDAVKHLIEDGTIVAHSDATHAWLKGFRNQYKAWNSQALTVGEVWDSSVAVSNYLQGDELDLAFDFDLAQAIINSARIGKAEQIERILSRDNKMLPDGQMATFLTNHDQDRTMLVLGDDLGKARAAAGMLLTIPGVPFVYYGEEIGMVGKKPDELIRTPMQWSGDLEAGFTSGMPWEPVNEDFPSRNVSSQEKDPESLLSYYQQLIRVRLAHAALRSGEFQAIETNSTALFAFLRYNQNETLLVLINLGEKPIIDYELTLSEGPLVGEYQIATVFGSESLGQRSVEAPQINLGGGFESYQPIAELTPQRVIILQLQPVD